MTGRSFLEYAGELAGLTKEARERTEELLELLV